MVKQLLVMVFIVMIMFVSGCTSQTDVSDVVKSLPQVQEFLKDHPNADIRAAIWDNDTVSENIDSIKEECGEQMRIKKMWKVEIEEDNQDILVWLDGETNEALCIVKHSAETDTSDTPPEDEDKIDCQYALIEADRDTATFDYTSIFEVTVESTGSSPIIVTGYEIVNDDGKRILSNFPEDIELSPQESRMLTLNVDQPPQKVKIITSCSPVFVTIHRPQGGWRLKVTDHCQYSNIELDRDYAKWDSTNKIFYGYVSNTGRDAITITRVESWVDGEKQLPIRLDSDNPDVTKIDKNDYKIFYVDLKSAFKSGGTALTKIKVVTECDPVFDSITQPQGGWNTFTWSGETLANK